MRNFCSEYPESLGEPITAFWGSNEVTSPIGNKEADEWCDRVIQEECGDELYFAIRKYPYIPVSINFVNGEWRWSTDDDTRDVSIYQDPSLWYRSVLHGRFWAIHEQEAYDMAAVLMEEGRAKNEEDAIRKAKNMVLSNEEKRIANYLFLPEKMGLSPEETQFCMSQLKIIDRKVKSMVEMGCKPEDIEEFENEEIHDITLHINEMRTRRAIEAQIVQEQQRQDYWRQKLAEQQAMNTQPQEFAAYQQNVNPYEQMMYQQQQQMSQNMGNPYQQQYGYQYPQQNPYGQQMMVNPYEQMIQQQQYVPQMMPPMSPQEATERARQEQFAMFGLNPNIANQSPEYIQQQQNVNPIDQMMYQQQVYAQQMVQATMQQQMYQQPQYGYQYSQQNPYEQQQMQAQQAFAGYQQAQQPITFADEMDKMYSQIKHQEYGIPNTDNLFKEDNLDYLKGANYIDMNLSNDSASYQPAHPNSTPYTQTDPYGRMLQQQTLQNYHMQGWPIVNYYVPQMQHQATTCPDFMSMPGQRSGEHQAVVNDVVNRKIQGTEGSFDEKKARMESMGYTYQLDENGKPEWRKEIPRPSQYDAIMRNNGNRYLVTADVNDIIKNLMIPGTSMMNVSNIYQNTPLAPIVNPNHPAQMPGGVNIVPDTNKLLNAAPDPMLTAPQQPIVQNPSMGYYSGYPQNGTYWPMTPTSRSAYHNEPHPQMYYGPQVYRQTSVSPNGLYFDPNNEWMMWTKEEIEEGIGVNVGVRRGDKVTYPYGYVEPKKKKQDPPIPEGYTWKDLVCVKKLKKVCVNGEEKYITTYHGTTPYAEEMARLRDKEAEEEEKKSEGDAAHDIKDMAIKFQAIEMKAIVETLCTELNMYKDHTMANQLIYAFEQEPEYLDECKANAIAALRKHRAEDPKANPLSILNYIDGKTKMSYSEKLEAIRADEEKHKLDSIQDSDDSELFKKFEEKCKPATDILTNTINSAKEAISGGTTTSVIRYMQALSAGVIDGVGVYSADDVERSLDYRSRNTLNSIPPMFYDNAANYAFWKKAMKNVAPKDVDYDEYFANWWSRGRNGEMPEEKKTKDQIRLEMTKVYNDNFIDRIFNLINYPIDKGLAFMRKCESYFRDFDQGAPMKCKTLYDFFHGPYGLGFMEFRKRAMDFRRHSYAAANHYNVCGFHNDMMTAIKSSMNLNNSSGKSTLPVNELTKSDLYMGKRQRFMSGNFRKPGPLMS